MTDDKLALIADFSEKALLYEVSLTPKPGLVDQLSNGAHHDMNFATFVDSIASLRPYFLDYLKAGLTHKQGLTKLFDKLRAIGIEAERAMLKATKGINTHKGANFSFAVILGATGYHLQNKENLAFTSTDSHQVLSLVSQMTSDLVKNDFEGLTAKNGLSYGEKLYLEKGLTGIRGEAMNGYPVLQKQLLPFLRTSDRSDVEYTLLQTLVYLMSEVEDGNILHRGGYDAWLQVKEESKKIHQANLSKKDLLDELKKYDQTMIARHLSPGGSADLLALGIYFAFLEELI